MFVRLLRILGVTPNGGKTGKREAAWAILFITISFTAACMAISETMVEAMTPILIMMWPTACTLVAGAYKLEFDKQEKLLELPGHVSGSPAADPGIGYPDVPDGAVG